MSGPLFRKLAKHIPFHKTLKLINHWKPLRGAGIRVTHCSEDLLEIDVEMPLKWSNTNYVGTHFGGSLYSMVDPFFMLMLIQKLGPEYIVWDKGAKIDFKKPGRGTVRAQFRFTEAEIADIKLKADSQEKYIFDKEVNVTNEQQEVVTHVVKTLYVKRKKPT
jgi:acyl-coenzyme A thioesterase PaaI-like protein